MAGGQEGFKREPLQGATLCWSPVSNFFIFPSLFSRRTVYYLQAGRFKTSLRLSLHFSQVLGFSSRSFSSKRTMEPKRVLRKRDAAGKPETEAAKKQIEKQKVTKRQSGGIGKVQLNLPDGIYNQFEEPVVAVLNPSLPAYTQLMEFREGFEKIGLGKMISLPWNCECFNLMSELAAYNQRPKEAREKSWRCDYTLWALKDFREIFQLAEGGNDMSRLKKGKPEDYNSYFCDDYITNNGWRVRDVLDDGLRTIFAFINPFLHPAQPYRLFVNQMAAIVDAYENNKKLDWGPVLLKSMKDEAKTAGIHEYSYLSSLVFHFYQGMGCLYTGEELMWKKKKKSFIFDEGSDPKKAGEGDTDLEDEGKVVTLPKTSSKGQNPKAKKKDSRFDDLPAVKRKRLALSPVGKEKAAVSDCIELQDSDEEGDRNRPSLQWMMKGKTGTLLEMDSFMSGNTAEAKAYNVAYFDLQLDYEKQVGKALQAAGVKSVDRLVDWVRSTAANQFKEDEFLALQASIKLKDSLIAALKEKQSKTDQVIQNSVDLVSVPLQNTIESLEALCIWKETFPEVLPQKMKEEGRNSLVPKDSVVDKNAVILMNAAWDNVLEDAEEHIATFQSCVKEGDEFKAKVNDLLGYYRAFEEVLKANFEAQGPEDALKELAASSDGSPLKMLHSGGHRGASSSRDVLKFQDNSKASISSAAGGEIPLMNSGIDEEMQDLIPAPENPGSPSGAEVKNLEGVLPKALPTPFQNVVGDVITDLKASGTGEATETVSAV